MRSKLLRVGLIYSDIFGNWLKKFCQPVAVVYNMRKIIWFVLDCCLIIGFLLLAWKFRWLFWGRWPGIRVNAEGSWQGRLMFPIIFCAPWPFQLTFQIFLEKHFSFSSLYFGVIWSALIFWRGGWLEFYVTLEKESLKKLGSVRVRVRVRV